MNVKWNRKAEKQFDDAIFYCQNVFGESSAKKFFHKVAQYIPRLSANPLIGKVEPLLADKPITYRSIVVHKHFKLIYYIVPDRQIIRIAALWDTRREPGALKGQV